MPRYTDSLPLAVAFCLLVLTLHAPAAEYFVASKDASGTGTMADPFGLPDLPDPTSEKLKSKALEALQPGDTLTFLAGEYRLTTLADRRYYYLGYLRTARPGLPDERITLRAKPGETVRLIHAGGSQPMFGGGQYTTIEGFIIETGPMPAARIAGVGMEIGFCLIKGQHVDTSDNHDGIRIERCDGCRIHHCEITGVTGRSSNSAAIKLYTTSNAVIEDNYIHDNTAGLFDKDSGIDNTYRRNLVVRNKLNFDGRVQGKVARYHIHDNVIDGQISLHCGTDGCDIHNNLIRGEALVGGWAGGVMNNRIYNNIVLSGGKPILAFYDHQVPWGEKAHLVYMDHNVYDAPPSYSFGLYSQPKSKFTLEQMRGKGFEISSRIVTGAAEVFEDEKTWKLKPAFQKAGRDGASPGPADQVQILDTTRYGPAARGK